MHIRTHARTNTEGLRPDRDQQRGECVLVVEGAPAPQADEVGDEALRVLDLLLAELPLKRAAKLASEITGVRKNLLYQIALERGAQ